MILKKQSGISLIELVIAMTVFTIGVSTLIFLIMDTGIASRQGSTRTKAVLLAQEGIEAVRTMRDANFSNVTNGTYGISLVGGQWVLANSFDNQDEFTRTITISEDGSSNLKKVTSKVIWELNSVRPQSVEFTEYLSYWKHPPLTEINCFSVDLSGASIEQGAANKIIRYIWIRNPSCGYAITLDKLKLTWDIPGNNLFKARINAQFLWQGSADSGAIVDLVPNYTLGSGDPAVEIDQLRWTQSILGSPIGVEFIMSDSSSQGFTIPAF